MAGARAKFFAALVKEYRQTLRLPKKEIIGFLSVSSEVPGWVNSKCKGIIRREERKEKRKALSDSKQTPF